MEEATNFYVNNHETCHYSQAVWSLVQAIFLLTALNLSEGLTLNVNGEKEYFHLPLRKLSRHWQ